MVRRVRERRGLRGRDDELRLPLINENRPRLMMLRTQPRRYEEDSNEDDEEMRRRRPPRNRRKPYRSRGGSAADEAELRVSVYCVGDVVDCGVLLKRLERGKVARPRGPWVDVLWENAVHSSQMVECKKQQRRTHLEDEDAGDLGDFEASEEDVAPPRSPPRSPPRDEYWTKHVFVFGFGCVVMWGFDKSEERELVAGLLGDHSVDAGLTSAAERVEAHDTMTYKVEAGRGTCKNDVIRLSSDDPLEKFSLSYALAQSAKLFIWEFRVDVTIKEVKHIPERLAATGKTDLTEKRISQMIGKVFIERTQVNLHSEILDVPELLWEDDQHEPGYVELRQHLDVPERVDLLNNRLDILKELLEVLNTQLSNHHSSRLEIIVIWLIIAEILVTLFAFIMDRLLPRGYSHD
ncbi:hypothetical protein CTAYLR_008086 [Chrysophaeum taylorii]|uniref:DUF155 domain-containing protein n=1 Tax=Chrysophaeum taylorii TaxID=2483200 RepID=A0AAD7XLQ8_9STRA|nr:hypothetical protein CTAYLR_008086 [Chrysophaeum taylorii]